MSQMRTIVDIRRLLAQVLKGHQLIWLGRKAFDADGLSAMTGRRVLIYAADCGTEMSLLADPDAVHTMQNGAREDWDTHELVDWFCTPEVTASVIAKSEGTPVILPYQSNAKLEAHCRQMGWILLAPPVSVKQQFQDKLTLPLLLRQLGLPTLAERGLRVDLRHAAYATLQSTLGAEFVLQYPFGSGGNSTFLIRSERDFLSAKQLTTKYGQVVQVNPLLQGVSPNVNFVVTRFGTIVAPSSEQIIGVPSCGRERFSYNGNQWGTVPAGLRANLHRQMKALGNLMYARGYRGIAGADSILEYILEVNTRVNNSTALITRLCLEHDVIPPLAFHLLELLDVNYGVDMQAYQRQLDSLQWNVYQLIMHNVQPSFVQVAGEVVAGRYRFDAGLKLVARQATFSRLPEDELLLTCGVPPQGLLIAPNATIMKVMGHGQIYQSGKFALTQTGNEIVAAANQLLQLTQPELVLV